MDVIIIFFIFTFFVVLWSVIHCLKLTKKMQNTETHTHIRLLNQRSTDSNLNDEIVNIVVTAQSLI